MNANDDDGVVVVMSKICTVDFACVAGVLHRRDPKNIKQMQIIRWASSNDPSGSHSAPTLLPNNWARPLLCRVSRPEILTSSLSVVR